MNRVLASVVLAAVVVTVHTVSVRDGVFAAADICSGTLGQFGWTCETVDAPGDVGSLNHFVYGPDGVAHIGYTANVQQRGLRYATGLKYARRADGTWTTQVVDSSVGGAQAMLINPVTGSPAIGYGCLKLAEFTGTTWNLQTVVKDCGQSASAFAFDAAGTIYAAHSDKRTWRLNVGRRTGTTWAFQALAPEASYMSMVIAPDGLPSIAFENRQGALVYGHQQADGNWQFTTVDTSTVLVARVTLRFTGTGAAAISYRRDDEVRLATLDPGTGAWAIETVFTRPSNSSLDGVSVTFPNGEPLVTFAWTDLGSGVVTFMAARRMGAIWNRAAIEVIPSSGAGLVSNADYDPATGLVGVSYGVRGSSWNDLKFAEGPPAAIAQ